MSRGARAPDRVVAYGAQADQIIEIRSGAAAREHPLVILIHGGFWRPDIDRVHLRPLADAIAAAGWTAALPEYSRVAGDPAPTLADLALLLSRVAADVVGHDGRVVLVGHSAGGHLALWATAAQLCPPLVGTLALAPAADLRLAHELNLGEGAVTHFLGCDPARRPDLDPRRMPAPLTATTIVHGTEDEIVPLSVSESYVAAHPQVRLVSLAGAGHFALIDPLAPAWQVLMTELAAF